jgi:hypothetical protein
MTIFKKNYEAEYPHMRLTDCCSSWSTWMDDGTGTEVLSCKKCYEEVETGEGDGNEFISDYKIVIE